VRLEGFDEAAAHVAGGGREDVERLEIGCLLGAVG
jgi:hypothetical protein